MTDYASRTGSTNTKGIEEPYTDQDAVKFEAGLLTTAAGAAKGCFYLSSWRGDGC